MFNCFFPDEYLDSTYVINFDDLYAQGYRGLLFDIDNTLVPHGAPADERACALFAHLKELGFKCCFLSNNQYERVSSFNDAIGSIRISERNISIMRISPRRKIISGQWNFLGQTEVIQFL